MRFVAVDVTTFESFCKEAKLPSLLPAVVAKASLVAEFGADALLSSAMPPTDLDVRIIVSLGSVSAGVHTAFTVSVPGGG